MRKWLKDIRLAKGLSQLDVAKKVHITFQYYSYIENGDVSLWPWGFLIPGIACWKTTIRRGRAKSTHKKSPRISEGIR